MMGVSRQHTAKTLSLAFWSAMSAASYAAYSRSSLNDASVSSPVEDSLEAKTAARVNAELGQH